MIATLAGLLLGALACGLWYLAHPNQAALSRPLGRAWRGLGHLAAAAALALLITTLGAAPGLVAGLCLLQMGSVAAPYLVLARNRR